MPFQSDEEKSHVLYQTISTPSFHSWACLSDRIQLSSVKNSFGVHSDLTRSKLCIYNFLECMVASIAPWLSVCLVYERS